MALDMISKEQAKILENKNGNPILIGALLTILTNLSLND